MSDLTFLSLEFENFKTFSGSHTFQINQKPGLYFIQGRNDAEPELGANGVGKSTIWDALTWVLWGKTGRDGRPAAAIQPWDQKCSTIVDLYFKLGDEECLLTRTRNPNGLMFTKGEDAKEITQDQIPKLIGMSEEIFRRTLVLSQTGSLFLDLRPEQQAQMFTEALSLDVWLKAVEIANQSAKDQAKDVIAIEGGQSTTRILLEDIANQITEKAQQADVFDADKANKIAKLEKGIGTLIADLKIAEKDPVQKPQVPNTDRLAILQKESSSITSSLAILQRDINRATGDVKQLEQKMEAANKARKDPRCSECGQSISPKKLNAQIDTLRDEIQEAAKSALALRNEAAELHDASTAIADKIKAATAVYNEEKKTYDARLTKWSEWGKKVGSIKGELGRWQDDLIAAKAQENRAAAELAKMKERRSALRTTATTLRQDLIEVQEGAERSKYWVDAFREIRLSIIDETLIELEMAASRHAAMLGLNDWGIKFDTERETKSGSVSYAFSVLLYPPGKDEPVKWESYSGGESQRWQLAVAFGLSEVLLARAGITPSFECLDEPTKGLSPQGVQDLLEHLRDRALELGRAIYFVDHHSLDKGSFDGMLLVTKSDKGSSFKWQ